MTATLLLLLKSAVGLIILAIGMDARLRDLTYLWRRPGLLVRSLAAMYVLVPLVALLLARTLPLPVPVKVALLVLAVSAGAPLLPRKLLDLGQGDYIFGLVVTSSLLAIVTVPAWVAVLGPLFGQDVAVSPAHVAAVIGKSFLLPLAAGMVVRGLFPRIAEKLGDRLMAVAGIVLTGSALALLGLHWEVFVAAGWVFVLSLAALSSASLAIGHWLGGPAPDDRTALAIACATRHIGLAVLVAATVPGPRTAVLIAAYFLASALVSIPYLKWRRSGAAA
jgi:BASS family bile acid:Na+ symporter